VFEQRTKPADYKQIIQFRNTSTITD